MFINRYAATYDLFKLKMVDQPAITVGIMDQRTEVLGNLDGAFHEGRFGSISGRFSVRAEAGNIIFFNEVHREIHRSPLIKLAAPEGSTFSLFNVPIGKHFHWERTEDQIFKGELILQMREGGTIAVINRIPLEDYLKCVISSEMNSDAPMEFLKAHTILSRSWLLAGLGRKKITEKTSVPPGKAADGERILWYDREDHDLFDVCADDHCQRYHGITKIAFKQVEEAVGETQGRVITFEDQICDARYSKACGGLTEEFDIAWDNKQVPYLRSISDAPVTYPSIKTEEDACRWILSEAEAYCNIKEEGLLEKILPNGDRETKNFFRWKVEYSRQELEEILRKKSDLDFGTLKEIIPVQRGSSGRICRLKIVGSKRSMIVGKELEIRRWLSRTHLYSSAFVIVTKCNLNGEVERFTFNGAGWGHGVGLCQIGAAVMANKGFRAEQILKHYFRGVEIKKIY